MKKPTAFAVILLLFLAACSETGNESARSKPITQAAGMVRLLTDANPEWQFEHLRLYPVVASPEALAAAGTLPALKTLSEGMELKGFRVTERKQFGRGDGRWYNALTVQNKSSYPIFLMAGDVVQGGNQDRVIAFDDVIQPGTLKNIEVFCVESGRSSYFDPEAPAAEKRVAAFHGYYNVASPKVRKAVYTGDQQGVWNAVASVTAANKAESHTHAYTGLETKNDQNAKRAAYLNFFRDKFSGLPNAVGVVAVCNGEVLGVDIFCQPDLFKRQFSALIHGYAAEAAVFTGARQGGSDALAQDAFYSVATQADGRTGAPETAGKFSLNGQWVHLFRK